MIERKSKITVKEYYNRFAEVEHRRLFAGAGKLEFERTKYILNNFLPPIPATILDIGGGTGQCSAC